MDCGCWVESFWFGLPEPHRYVCGIMAFSGIRKGSWTIFVHLLLGSREGLSLMLSGFGESKFQGLEHKARPSRVYLSHGPASKYAT